MPQGRPWEKYGTAAPATAAPAPAAGPWEKYGAPPPAAPAAPDATAQAQASIRSTPMQEADNPGFFERLSEVTLGTRHPVDQAITEGKMLWNDPIGTAKQTGKQLGQMAYGIASDPIGTVKAITGGEQFAEDVQQGNWSGAAGSMAGGITNAFAPKAAERAPAAAGAIGQTAGRAYRGGRELAAQAVRSPDNKLRQGTKVVVDAAATAAGAAAGGPAGALVGRLSGRTAAKAILPKRRTTVAQPPPAAPEPRLGSTENPGWQVKLPNRMPRGKVKEPAPAAAGEAATGTAPAPPAAPATPFAEVIGDLPIKLDPDMPPGPDSMGLVHFVATDIQAPAVGGQPAKVSMALPEGKVTADNLRAALDKKRADFAPAEPIKASEEIGQVSELRSRGFTQEHINQMAPAEAEHALKLTKPADVPPVKADMTAEQIGQTLEPESRPLERGVTLGKQKPYEQRPAAAPKDESVHTMDRQIIHSDGSRILQAAGGDLDLIERIHGIEDHQLGWALSESGEDMGTRVVGNRGKTGNPDNYSRPEVFEILLEKGYTPEQIIKISEGAPRRKPYAPRKAFGPPREGARP